MYVYVYVCVYVYVNVCVYVYVYVHVYVYMYIYIYTYTYIHLWCPFGVTSHTSHVPALGLFKPWVTPVHLPPNVKHLNTWCLSNGFGQI